MPAGWIAGGAALVGAGISAYGANSAANTQADSANKASAQEMQMYNENVQRLQPWTQAGSGALSELTGLLGSNGMNGALTTPFSAQQYQQSPGYQWQLQQGGQAVTNAASAMGGVQSGNTLKALTSYGQGLANQDYYQAQGAYQNWQNQVYGMLSGVSNTGANAAGQTAGLGASVANSVGQNTIGAGNANAAGQVGMSNALSGGLGSVGNLALWQQMQNNQNPLPAIDTGDYAAGQIGNTQGTY
jgi:hypothetical protein